MNIARNPANQFNAIEAPFLTKNGDYYYLFVNWDTCCAGEDSTYKMRVGRGTSPTGPFRGRNGVAMTSGGGELFLATEGDFIGPGHFSDYSEDGINYFSYHYYDGDDGGRSKLGIREYSWTYDGWPVLITDLPPGDYNRDGIVDAADYTVWRNALGSETDLLANGDNTGESAGVIDQADYIVWRDNYGAVYSIYGGGAGGLAADAAVPEPASLCLASLAAAAFGCRRSRRIA